MMCRDSDHGGAPIARNLIHKDIPRFAGADQRGCGGRKRQFWYVDIFGD